MTDYGLVMTVKFPDAEYAVTEDGQFLAWDGPGDAPTVAEMDGWWPEVQALAANADAERERRKAYEREADPLFMEWQAGEGTEEAWLAKREEVRQRYPYVPVP
jgi:hypothetical protein